MTVTLLALGAALLYGTADFCGGAAARRATTLSVLLISLCSGLVVLVVAAIWLAGSLSYAAVGWGLAAGIAGGGGLFVFYGALARGPMSVVAPVSALVAAMLPVGAGLARGERLSAGVLGGVILCVVAIALVSMESRTAATDAPAGRGPGNSTAGRSGGSGPVLAVAAGTFFGLFFILLREAGEEGTVWPLITARGAGIVVAVVAVLLAGAPAAPWSALRSPVTASIALGAGVFDAAANTLYLLATRVGLLSLAAVLTALYPAITVLLARIVYGERLRMVQRIGLLVAASGVVLVTLG